MNHKWGKITKNDYMGTQLCTVCGCERSKTYHGYAYTRSKQFFGINNRPDCIDWEVENNKTID